MLRYLSIRNLAVIESVDVEFDAGLTVLTGETGAGKSILVEAVGLLLGGRASADLVRTGEEMAQVQALFERADGEELTLRREVTPQGRSRAFVNNIVLSAAALRDAAEGLVELHGQHEHQVLADPETHLDLLDQHAGFGSCRAELAAAYDAWQMLQRERDALRLDEREKATRIDLLTFQRDEIAKAAVKAGEDEALAATRQVLANAERLQRLAGEAYAALYEADGAVLSGLTTVWRRVADLAALDERVQPYVEARDGIKSQLEDLAFFLRGYGDAIEASPERLQEVDDRLVVLDRLKKKYGPTLLDVIAHADACAHELDSLSHSEARGARLDEHITATRAEYVERAQALSTARRHAAENFARRLETILAELAMARTAFAVRFNDAPLPEAAWSARGIDGAEFVVSPNPGEELRPLARIASGGELSRIMLALRSLSIGRGDGRTLIFDEVDAGIGGRAADDVGRKLKALGQSAQVLCITHLPQIAACGDAQFQVSKRVSGQRTATSVTRLDVRARTEELARMMAGGTVTPATLASAGELLASKGAKGEAAAKGESETVRAKPARSKGKVT
jgi:DNA repair protein RecN (Recombination protein N)